MDQQTWSESENKHTVVGIGASAGGIQALKLFFEQVPADSGLAFVVILHLSPDHDSRLVEVLSISSKIPVQQVKHSTLVEPNNVYVIPPNQHLIMEDGHVNTSPNLRVEDRRAPVDIFFRALAETHGPKAVCVVLSGTGANGSMGLKRVKERGGAVFVQNPREAEFNEMPRNAISTDMADAILPVSEIPDAIINYRNNLGVVRISVDQEDHPEDDENVLREIFSQLRMTTGHDFSNYKRPTLLRRIERRLIIRNLPNLKAYNDHLKAHPEETHALLKDLLISVTNFFRDAKAFDALQSEILSTIIKNKTVGEQVRIWVAGCATGEEAYSIAMQCVELTTNVPDAPLIQIFTSDIDEEAIAIAREGVYTINDAADVSPERLRRFFNRVGEEYRVRREIREMVLFANHNFLKDPPFSRLDLITCRNVLIYLNRAAQERVMETFHFALNPGGFLFLGSSESIDNASNLFDTVNREQHFFKTKPIARRLYPVPESVPSFRIDQNIDFTGTKEKSNRSYERVSYGDLHQRLLEEYASPSLIINEEYEIVHITEHAAPYLHYAAGEPSQNLLMLIRDELRLDLQSALYQAIHQKKPVEAKGISVNLGDRTEVVNIVVKPVFKETDAARGFVLVMFERTEEAPVQREVVVRSGESVSRHLEETVMKLKNQLRLGNEQHLFQAEELKASNEELQAMNEELRSAAEELETSKEELQSMNEELRTVNQELKVKIEETSLASNNLQNLINSADIGTIFLDRSLRLALFTPPVANLFNLIPNDIGRPLTDITHKLNYHDFTADIETVMDKLQPMAVEVSTTDGLVFMMRILPYRTNEDRINGVIITFFDITARKRDEDALRISGERYRAALDSASMAAWDWNIAADEVIWNDQHFFLLGLSPDNKTKKLADLLQYVHPDDMAKVNAAFKMATEDSGIYKVEFRIITAGTTAIKWMSGFGRVIARVNDKPSRMVGVMYDITEHKMLEKQKEDFIAITSHELRTPVTSLKIYGEVLQERLIAINDREAANISQKLNGQVNRLIHLIYDLLDTSQLVEGNITLKKEVFNMNELIDERIAEMATSASERRFDFKRAKFPDVKADRERIGQVVTNLLSNAMKYSPPSTDVAITAEKVTGGMLVTVADQGIGISAALIGKIFDRFVRFQNSNMQTYPGMGLGLYISSGIIQRHGGTIGVESKENEGSVFHFTIPI